MRKKGASYSTKRANINSLRENSARVRITASDYFPRRQFRWDFTRLSDIFSNGFFLYRRLFWLVSLFLSWRVFFVSFMFLTPRLSYPHINRRKKKIWKGLAHPQCFVSSYPRANLGSKIDVSAQLPDIFRKHEASPDIFWNTLFHVCCPLSLGKVATSERHTFLAARFFWGFSSIWESHPKVVYIPLCATFCSGT